MAYYDLASNPTSIRSKSSGGKTPIDVSSFRPKNKKPIGIDWDVNPGDILSWSDYRAADTYFVTKQRLLRKNRDTSDSGYLTIPLSITRLFPSAMKHYAQVLESESDLVSAIELAPTDGIFTEKFGSPLPEAICNRNDISFVCNPMEEVFYVVIHDDYGDGFPIDGTKTEEIVEYINTANDTKTAFIVSYDIKGKEVLDRWPRASPKGLPAGWNCNLHGGASSGHDFIKSAWRLEGPEKTKETAYKVAEKYYDGFGVDITWESDSS